MRRHFEDMNPAPNPGMVPKALGAEPADQRRTSRATELHMADPQKQAAESAPKGRRWLAPLHKAYARFVKIRGNPREISLGFALGIFVGMSPFMGLHTAIAVFLAALLKWNKISAALAVWLSNPITAPVLYGITYLVGARVLAFENHYQLPHAFNLDSLLYILRSAPELIWVLVVGGIVTGVPLAIVSYFIAHLTITKYRESLRRKQAVEKAAALAQKIKDRRKALKPSPRRRRK